MRGVSKTVQNNPICRLIAKLSTRQIYNRIKFPVSDKDFETWFWWSEKGMPKKQSQQLASSKWTLKLRSTLISLGFPCIVLSVFLLVPFRFSKNCQKHMQWNRQKEGLLQNKTQRVKIRPPHRGFNSICRHSDESEHHEDETTWYLIHPQGKSERTNRVDSEAVLKRVVAHGHHGWMIKCIFREGPSSSWGYCDEKYVCCVLEHFNRERRHLIDRYNELYSIPAEAS